MTVGSWGEMNGAVTLMRVMTKAIPMPTNIKALPCPFPMSGESRFPIREAVLLAGIILLHSLTLGSR